jgi:hypothetical protein
VLPVGAPGNRIVRTEHSTLKEEGAIKRAFQKGLETIFPESFVLGHHLFVGSLQECSQARNVVVDKGKDGALQVGSKLAKYGSRVAARLLLCLFGGSLGSSVGKALLLNLIRSFIDGIHKVELVAVLGSAAALQTPSFMMFLDPAMKGPKGVGRQVKLRGQERRNGASVTGLQIVSRGIQKAWYLMESK